MSRAASLALGPKINLDADLSIEPLSPKLRADTIARVDMECSVLLMCSDTCWSRELSLTPISVQQQPCPTDSKLISCRPTTPVVAQCPSTLGPARGLRTLRGLPSNETHATLRDEGLICTTEASQFYLCYLGRCPFEVRTKRHAPKPVYISCTWTFSLFKCFGGIYRSTNTPTVPDLKLLCLV